MNDLSGLISYLSGYLAEDECDYHMKMNDEGKYDIKVILGNREFNFCNIETRKQAGKVAYDNIVLVAIEMLVNDECWETYINKF